MFFTQEDYKKIQTWLNQNAIKDSEFKEASLPLNEYDIISFVQNGNNVKVRLKDFLEQLFLLREFSDFINVTDKYKAKYILLKQAIQLVPYKTRKIGQVITFLNEEKEWKIYQFKGESVNQWNEESLWEDIVKAIQGSDLAADEEDLTEVVDEVSGKSLLKLKDKAYDPDNFSGLGRVILRKNIVTILNPDTQEGQDINLLTQQMINKPNTIYEIQYDFDLNNQEITIPEGCILDFKGGSLNNGIINFNNTIIYNERFVNNEYKGDIIINHPIIDNNFTNNKKDDSSLFKFLITNASNNNVNLEFTRDFNIEHPKSDEWIIITNKCNFKINGNNHNIIDNTKDIGKTIKYFITLNNCSNIDICNFNIKPQYQQSVPEKSTGKYFIKTENNCSNINIYNIYAEYYRGVLYQGSFGINTKESKGLTNSNIYNIKCFKCVYASAIEVCNNCFFDVENLDGHRGFYITGASNCTIKVISKNQDTRTACLVKDSFHINNEGNIEPIAYNNLTFDIIDITEDSDLYLDQCGVHLSTYGNEYDFINRNNSYFCNNIIINSFNSLYNNCSVFNISFDKVTNSSINDKIDLSLNSITTSSKKHLFIVSGKIEFNIKLNNVSVIKDNNLNIIEIKTNNLNQALNKLNIIDSRINNIIINGDDCAEITLFNSKYKEISGSNEKYFINCFNSNSENEGPEVFKSKVNMFNNNLIKTDDFNFYRKSVQGINYIETDGKPIHLGLSKYNIIVGSILHFYIYNKSNTTSSKIELDSIIKIIGNNNDKNNIFIIPNNSIVYIKVLCITKTEIYAIFEISKSLVSDIVEKNNIGSYIINNDKPIWFQGNKWIDSNGNSISSIKTGTTQQRPTDVKAGFYYFDTTLNKPIWKKDDTTNVWIDAMGAEV